MADACVRKRAELTAASEEIERRMTPARQKATNVTWQEGLVTREDRYQILRQKGATIWFTGLSGSGKSTIAVALERALFRGGKLSYRLDGDNVRLGINKNLGFSEADRRENIRRIGEVAKLFGDAGAISLSAFISPYASDRDEVRRLHEDAGLRFVEVFVDCPLSEAERRDPKGLYRRARAGEIRNFTGIDDPYEKPVNPEIHLRTDRLTVEEEVSAIIDYLERNGIIDTVRIGGSLRPPERDDSPDDTKRGDASRGLEPGSAAAGPERSDASGQAKRNVSAGDAR